MIKKLISNIFRKIPKFKGKAYLYNYLDKVLRKYSSETVVQVGRIKYKLNTNDIIQRQIMYEGKYEKNIVHIIKALSRQKDDGVIWDVGANIGAIALPTAEALADWSIYCFEPSPHLTYRLHTNVTINDSLSDRIFVVQSALGDETKVSNFFISDEDCNTGVGSLGRYHNTKKKGIGVFQTTGDRIIDDGIAEIPDIIKIDVEGFEYEVIKGMSNITKRKNIALIFEVSKYRIKERNISVKKLISHIENRGFNVYQKNGRRIPKSFSSGNLTKDLIAVKGVFEKTEW